MAFCPVCDNDTLSVGNIYTDEAETMEICFDQCPYCGYYEEYNCDDDEYEDEVEFPADELGGHKDVWVEVDGHQQRVLGDPNMSEETKQALAEMIKAVQNGNFKKKE